MSLWVFELAHRNPFFVRVRVAVGRFTSECHELFLTLVFCLIRLSIVKIMGEQAIEVQPKECGKKILYTIRIVKIMGVRTIEVQPKRVR